MKKLVALVAVLSVLMFAVYFFDRSERNREVDEFVKKIRLGMTEKEIASVCHRPTRILNWSGSQGSGNYFRYEFPSWWSSKIDVDRNVIQCDVQFIGEAGKGVVLEVTVRQMFSKRAYVVLR